MTETDRVETIRDLSPLAEVAAEYTELQQSGRAFVGRCPLHDHEDQKPSFYVYPDQGWYCFGCSRGGDVFSFVQIMHGVDFAGSLSLLAHRTGSELNLGTEEFARQGELLDLEREVDKTAGHLSKEQRAYLRSRGLTDETIARLRIGALPSDSLLLPVLRYGRPVYAFQHRPDGDPRYRFPRGQSRPLIGTEFLRSGFSPHVVEGYFDAAVLTQAGFHAVGLLGTGKKSDADALAHADHVFLLLDGDEAGQRAARSLAIDLYPKAKIVPVPEGKDPNDLAVEMEERFSAEVNRLTAEAKDALDLHLEAIHQESSAASVESSYPLLARLEGASLDAAVTRVGRAAKDLGIRKQTIREGAEREKERLQRVPHDTDSQPSGRSNKEEDPGIQEEAQTLLESPDLLEDMLRATDRLGHQGEEANRKMVFLAGVSGHLSRSHEDAIHLVVKGGSSGGKNELVRCVLSLLPPQRVRFLTGVSQQALIYQGGHVEGVLVFQEAEGEEDAEYAIRQAMSEGWLERWTVMDGQAITVRTYVTGSIITTTTQVSLHDENQTRVFDLHVDESRELTRKVIDAVGRSLEGRGLSEDEQKRLLAVWRTALSSLKPASVVIPYASAIASRFPDTLLRARRDIMRTGNLIRASALLHQRQRPCDVDGRLIAGLEDYRMVYPLIQAVLGSSMSGLTPKAIRVADLQHRLAAQREGEWVDRAELQKVAQAEGAASEKTVRKWTTEFCDRGFWEARREGGKVQHRVLRDIVEEPVNLPTPDEMEELVGSGNEGLTRQESKEKADLLTSGSSRCARQASPQGASPTTTRADSTVASTTTTEPPAEKEVAAGSSEIPARAGTTDQPVPASQRREDQAGHVLDDLEWEIV